MLERTCFKALQRRLCTGAKLEVETASIRMLKGFDLERGLANENRVRGMLGGM